MEGTTYALSERQSSVLCTALSVSVICNMYLVCAALKLVILTFKVFTFGDDFVYGTAVVFFRYLNLCEFLFILNGLF